MHEAIVFDMHARCIEVRTEQPFLIIICSAQRNMKEQPVSTWHARQSKYAQSNQFYMRARLNEVCTVQPFSICHARCCEVCTEYAGSSHRSMHGVTVLCACSVQRSMHAALEPFLICMLGGAKYAQSTRF